MRALHFILLAVTTWIADCQFLYPVDENPPNNPLTFNCYKCNGESDSGCSEAQSESRTSEECSGIRIGCWTILDVEAGVYERTCTQPESVRQGVFCNRHMEGREFCYYESTQSGLKKKCSMCCLNDFCNGNLLTGEPDTFFQTCIECDGRSEPECNQGGREDFGKHMMEQCLLPNSDCWTAKTIYEGDTTYTRGCQIAECNDENIEETCTTTEDSTTCSKCCPDAEKCNYGHLAGDGRQLTQSKLAVFILTVICILVANQ